MDEIYIVEAGKRRRGEKYTCQICDVEFWRRAGRNHRFCSNTCSSAARKKQCRVTCANCGEEVSKTASKLKGSKSGLYFCTRKCKDDAQRIGGIREIMPDHYGISGGYGYIWGRRKPECVDCKENREYYLFVHHIDGNHSNNDENNLEIVCVKCHCKRHLLWKNDKWIYSTKALTPRHLLSEL